MGELRMVVDHMKLDYAGLFDIDALFAAIDHWLFERGYEKKTAINQEISTAKGKSLEWQSEPWKKISDYIRLMIKIRILIDDLKRVEAMHGKEKKKLGQGRVLIYLDGFIEYDYDHKWDSRPFFVFFRTLWDKFIYKPYTEKFEQTLVYDANHLYHLLEAFFNVHRHYRVVSVVPHFYY